MRRVLLINWDNYPHFATGGVYTWVKSLVDNAKDWEFIVFNQLSNPNANARYQVPRNVKKVIGLPVFGTHRCEEYYPENGPLLAKIARTTDEVIERRFLPLYQRFLSSVLADDGDPKTLAQVVYELHQLLVSYDPKKCFEYGLTWDTFISQVKGDKLYKEMKLSEALLNFQVIQRSLQVLSVRLPKVEIIHSSLAWLPALAGVSGKLENDCPLVITEHGVAFRELMLYYNMFLYNEMSKLFWTVFTRNVVRTIYHTADLIIPVCYANKVWEAKLGADESKIRVIYNGVDTERFKPLSVPREDARPTVVSVARVSVFKDIIGLIQATNYVREEVPNVRTLVFGDATEMEYSEKCKSVVRRLRLEDNFKFMGGTKEPEKAYARADVVAFSSITEAFPFAVIEAMACGKPVVATDVGGVREALEGCGLLVRSRSPRDLASAIVKLLNDRELRSRLGTAAIARAREKFTLKDSVKQYLMVYGQLAAHNQEEASGREAQIVVSR
jgi:polysaccharide biosynthesis protein PelF